MARVGIARLTIAVIGIFAKSHMNKRQKNLIIAFFIWAILLLIVGNCVKIGLDQIEFFRDVSFGLVMFFGGFGFCGIWYLVETRKL